MTREKKMLVFMAVLGFSAFAMGVVCLIVLLPRLTKKEEAPQYVTQIAPDGSVLEVDKKTLQSFPKICELGHQYGRDGNFQKALECFRQVQEAVNYTERDWHCASAAAVAVGETNLALELCRRALELYGQNGDPNIAERTAKQCLVIPGVSGQMLDQAASLADACVRVGPPSSYRYIAKGMAEHRLGRWSEALTWLLKAADDVQPEVAAQAWSFIAMAHHQSGDSVKARKALEQVNRRLNAITKTGELGPPKWRSWEDSAYAMALRTEAERLILGKAVSAPMNPAAVVGGRKNWQEFSKLVSLGEDLGKHGRWQEASLAYMRAIQHPGFDLEVLELKQSLFLQEVGVAYLQCEDESGYRDLIRKLLDRDPEMIGTVMQGRYAKTVLIAPERFCPEGDRKRALALARLGYEQGDATKNTWLWLNRGIVEYREGNYEKAIESLRNFRLRENKGANATAIAFRAMALKKLGRSDEATQTALEAASAFAGPGSLADWNAVAVYQVVLRELSSLLALPDQPLKK